MKRYYRWISVIVILALAIGTTVLGSNQVRIKGVPVINQKPELPTGCELTALTMLLNYYGVKVSKTQLAQEVPKEPTPYYSKGVMYGGDPNKGFVGNPFTSNGFGVYKNPIIGLIEKYLPGRSEDLSGDFDKVYKALDEGRPVMIWATIGMLSVDRTVSKWQTAEGKKVEWKTPEHAVVLTGYDQTYIYLNDPYTGRERKYNKDTVINRWSAMGKQAVAIKQTKALGKSDNMNYKDAYIDGIKYVNLLMTDDQGKWIPARLMPNIFKNTTLEYEPSKGAVMNIRGEEATPDLTDVKVTQSEMVEVVPSDIEGKYAAQFVLNPLDKNIITYSPTGKKVTMTYKMVEGITYVNMDWVQGFYDVEIKTQ